MNTEEIISVSLTVVTAVGFGYIFYTILKRAITEKKPDNHSKARH